ncbi:MAG TPA: UMP kinase [Candidatus Aminicenantes bacterium]|nr:UMP kinase [Candidatus Aminicenantes bacterium]
MDDLPHFRRIVLKLSGEALKGDQSFGISTPVLQGIAAQIEELHKLGIEIALVTGGGNFFRGIAADELGMGRASADYMGMLATVINGIAIQDTLEKSGMKTRLISALEIKEVAEPFIRRRATRHLEKGRVVIFTAGTGSPFFSTDTAAALRAIEIQADILLKATMVDGVFSADPRKVPDARKFTTISYAEILSRDLRVMDATAVALCRENQLKIKIFDINKTGSIIEAVHSDRIGTLIQ